MNSILAKLVEYDIFLKNIREAYHKNAKYLIEIEQGRKEDIEKNTIKELEEIEKLVYHKFQLLIDQLKLNQEKYAKENMKLFNEVNFLKKEKVEIHIKIREMINRVNSLRFNIGESSENNYYD